MQADFRAPLLHGYPETPRFGLATWAIATAALSSVLFGYHTVVLNSCAELIAVKLQWCDNNWQSDCPRSNLLIALANASLYLGAALGAFICGKARVAALGARRQIMLSDVLFIAGGLSAAAARNTGMLLAGRLLSGVGFGVCIIAAPIYIAEIFPTYSRGVTFSVNEVGITSGILLAFCLSLLQGPAPSSAAETLTGLDAWYWRCLLSGPVLLAFVQFTTFLLVLPIDTPSFLVRQGLLHEARTVIYKTYAMEVPEDPLNVNSVQAAKLEMEINDLIDAEEYSKDVPRVPIGQALRRPLMRCAVLLGFGLAALQQLCGINVLMAYSNRLFSEAGVPASRTTIASTAMATLNVAASIFSTKFVDIWGRRRLLLCGSRGQALSMAVLCLFGLPSLRFLLGPTIEGVLTVVAFSLFVMSFSAGLGPITWLYLEEMYPVDLRGAALDACGVINWLSAFAIVFIAKFLNLGQTCVLLFSISAIGYSGIYLWAIEIKHYDASSPRSARTGSWGSSPHFTPRSHGNTPESEPQELKSENEKDMVI